MIYTLYDTYSTVLYFTLAVAESDDGDTCVRAYVRPSVLIVDKVKDERLQEKDRRDSNGVHVEDGRSVPALAVIT